MQAVPILDSNKLGQGRYQEGGDTAASLMKRSQLDQGRGDRVKGIYRVLKWTCPQAHDFHLVDSGVGRKWLRVWRTTVDKAEQKPGLCSNTGELCGLGIICRKKKKKKDGVMAFCAGIKANRDTDPVIQPCRHSLTQLRTLKTKRFRNVILCIFRPGSSLDLKAGEGKLPFIHSGQLDGWKACTRVGESRKQVLGRALLLLSAEQFLRPL